MSEGAAKQNESKRRMWNSSKEFMNGTRLQIQQSYGCSQEPIRKNVIMIDDDRLIYQCGKHIVEYDLLHKKQNYILKNIEDEDITSINYSLSSSDTLSIVVGLKGSKGFPCLKVLKRKQTNHITFPHQHLEQNSTIIDCAFLLKGKNVISLAKEESKYCITIYGVQREKMLFTRDILNTVITMIEPVSQIPEEFYLIGPKYFILWKLNTSEKGLSDEPFEFQTNLASPEEEIVEVCQIPDTDYLAFVTNQNALYYYKQRQFKQRVALEVSYDLLKEEQEKKPKNQMINSLKKQSQIVEKADLTSSGAAAAAVTGTNAEEELKIKIKTIPPYKISALAPLFNGFLVGFEGTGVIQSYELEKRSELLYSKGSFRINQPLIHRVVNMSCSVQENIVALAVQHAPRLMQAIDTLTRKDSSISNSNTHNNNNNNNNNNSHNNSQQSQTDLNLIPGKSSEESNMEVQSQKSQQRISSKQSLDNISLNKMNSVQEKPAKQAKKGEKQNHHHNHHNQHPDQMGRIDLYIFNYGIAEVISATQKDAFEPLFFEGVHKGTIVDCCVCPSRSILLTLSEDKSLKTWEFSLTTGVFKCLFTTYFHENPLSVSLHPLSFQAAVGFREGLKFFFLLEDELKLVFNETNVKLCNALCYSEWGNLLGASNFNLIHLYDPNTFECLMVLNGHSGTVKQLRWMSDDSVLVSNCTSGILNSWNVWKENRIIEHAFKQIKYTACTYDLDLDWCICCTPDSKIKLFDDKGQNPIYELDISPVNASCVLLVKDLGIMLVGTSAGSVRSYNWPFDISNKTQEWFEITLHQTAVTSLKISKDLNFLITGSDNGSLYFLRLRQFSNGNEIEISNALSDEAFSVGSQYCLNQLCSSSLQSQENKKDQIKELEFRISNLKTDQEDEKENMVNEINSLLKREEDQNKDVVSKQKEQLSKVMEDCDLKYKDLIFQIESLRSQKSEQVSKMEEVNMESLLGLYSESDNLKQELEDVQKFSEDQLRDLTQSYKQIIKHADLDFKKKYQELFERFSSSVDKCDEDQRKFGEVLLQTTDEHEEFLAKTKMKLLEEKENEIKRSEDFRTSNSKKQKEIERFNQRRLELESILKEAQNQIDHLEEERMHFNEKNQLMQNQLQGKEEIINKKEQEIKEFRMKNSHLQNFKAVYDYQVTTLQEERAPLIDHSKNMEKNVKNMYKELLDEAEAQKKITQKLHEIEEQIKKLKLQTKQKNDALAASRRKVESFEYEVQLMLKNDPFELWFQTMKRIYADYFDNEATKLKNKSGLFKPRDEQEEKLLQQLEANNTEQIREELIRQRDFMSKKIQANCRLEKQSEKDRDDAVIRVQSQNTHLIRECNILREEQVGLKEHLSSLEKTLDITTKELMRLALSSDIAEDEEFLEKELSKFEASKILDNLQVDNQPIFDSPKQIKKKAFKTNKTPFQRYDEERTLALMSKKGSSSVASLPLIRSEGNSMISQSKDNQSLLLSLLKDVEKSQIDKDSSMYDRLKERVSNYLYNEDQSLTILQISSADRTVLGQSQEETGIPQHSIISDSMNVSKSYQGDILSQVKGKSSNNNNNDSRFSKKSLHKTQASKSVLSLPQLKGNKF